MKRALLVLAGLTAFFALALGLRAYLGGHTYAAAVLGSADAASVLFARAASEVEARAFVFAPAALVAATGLALGLLYVLLLAPVEWLLRRRGLRRARVVVVGGLSAAATGAGLLSVHPILSLRGVSEGPRTFLNFACESAGYGYVNATMYVGAALAATGLLVRRAAAQRAEPPESTPSGSA